MTKMKFSLTILVLLVISSQSFLSISANDDEFAEFDDITPGQDRKSQDLNGQQQSSSKEDLKISPPADTKDPELSPKLSQPDETGSINKPIINDDVSDKKQDDSKASTKKRPQLKLVHAPSIWVYRWDSFYVELGFIFAFLMYFLNYLTGCNKNSVLVSEWFDKSYDVLKSNFCLIGGSPLLEVDKKNDSDEALKEKMSLQEVYKNRKGFVKMSESNYTLWCSGRVGTDGVLIQLDLHKRQDLFAMAFNLLKPSQETCLMHFLINNSEGYDNFVFCIANKVMAPRLARDMCDINVYCPKRKPISQCGVNSDRLFVMSETSDVVSYILDNYVTKFLETNEKLINYIHITDQYVIDRKEDETPALRLANSKRMAIFSFAIPSNPGEASEFVVFALYVLDRLRKFKLTRDSKQKCDKTRQKITGIQEKTALSLAQQKAKETKDALRRQEKEMMLTEEDPAKQRMWERKEAKRELKKSKMRVKQLKVKSM